MESEEFLLSELRFFYVNRKLRRTTKGSSVCSHVRIKTKYQITKVDGCYVFF